MKSKWKLTTLKEIVEFQRGLTYSKKDEVENSRNIVLRANNIDLLTNKLNLTDLRCLKEDITIPENKKVKKGGLIICIASGSKSHLGKVALIDQEYDFSFGGFMGQIIPKKNILSEYLFYVLTSKEYKLFIERLSSGININNLRFDKLGEFSFPLPPLPEQQRIVDILDHSFAAIDQAIENTAINKEYSKEIYEVFINNEFDDLKKKGSTKKLNEITLIRPPKNEAKEKLTEGSMVSFAPMEDLGINQKYLIPEKEKNLKDVYSGYTYFAENDVLLAKITPCFENGKLGIAKDLINEIGFGSSEYVVFRPSKELRPEFLYYFLSREKFRKEGINYMKGAVGHKRVSLEFVSNYLIPVPPLVTQDEIIDKVDTFFDLTNSLRSNYKKKIELLQELKQSILHKAFNGEL